MLYLYTGTDRTKARAAMDVGLKKHAKGAMVLHITDAHTVADLRTALSGPGMFGPPAGGRAVALDSILENEEMHVLAIEALPMMRDSGEPFFMLEGKIDAATRKTLEKHAESSEKFDAAKKPEDNAIFGLKNALAAGDKKKLWIGIERELIAGKSPEAVHGFLFWAAKDMCLRSPDNHARTLVAKLAELPHEARRRGEELEYALERFVLSGV